MGHCDMGSNCCERKLGSYLCMFAQALATLE
jgi:hypothetical protein